MAWSIGGDYIGHRTIDRTPGERLIENYSERVFTEIYDDLLVDENPDPVVIGIEGFEHMGGYTRNASAQTLELGFMVGSMYSMFNNGLRRVVLIPPCGNGSQEYQLYPEQLVTARERDRMGWEFRRAGKGKLSHARSAWDVAETARMVFR